ncbi:MAG: bifunctional 5,10-methylenetetrahydrofolate dehydrogenase/5,10-methenyltetrahydrofolate cyclohydrolase [Candidatus Vogelbacteria bacterium]|nr:bifunctional 5,10-methylenetetrahydrofolate dehydrogenase/5,10-methenyltetrahydrofolate cyclohydrolase [Candidatus Vogelbacteria bacterium]
MIIDGKKISAEIKEELKKQVALSGEKISLGVIWVGDYPISGRYVRMKKKFGEEAGIEVNIYKLPLTISTDDFIKKTREISEKESGIIIQLPLPEKVDYKLVLSNIPEGKDVDLLSEQAYLEFEKGVSKILPPVVGAIKEILERSGVTEDKISGLDVVCVGRGKLVGKPAASWFKNLGANVILLGRDTEDIGEFTKTADIIISGAGVPGIIKPYMFPEKSETKSGLTTTGQSGVILIDASTSDVGGKLIGDADPACAEKCSVFSPVPGGVGPITVAMLFKNLVTLQLGN